MTRGRANECPNPESLAAWLDEGLGPVEAAEIEVHLTGCDECRELVVHAHETLSAIDVLQPSVGCAPSMAPERVEVRRSPGPRPLWVAASMTAAAAAVVMLVQMQPAMWRQWTNPGAASKLADLVEAVGEERTVEARLSGGFHYGPLRAPVRSGGSSAAADNWTLLAAAGRIREEAERDPSAANLQALGLAHLVLGEHDGAVRALEDAVAEQAQVARYHSDLAAAYLARARQLDRPDDLPRALGAAERAVAADPALLEARFNRALALEALFLLDQARGAWEEYLAHDAASPWADEARRRLAALRQRSAAPNPTRNNSPPGITDTTVEAGLDWLLRQGLPAWADAVLAHDPARAASQHRDLVRYAEQLSTVSGDPFAASLVAGMAGEGPALLTYASTVRNIGQGLALIEADDTLGAEVSLGRGCSRAEGSFTLLCQIALGSLDVIKRKDQDADRRAADALAISQRVGYVYSASWARKLAGYRLIFAGNYAGATEPYREAYQGFRHAKYLEQAGLMALQLADLYDLLGLPIEGWDWRERALELSASAKAPFLRVMTGVSTAEVLARRQQFEAGLAFLSVVDSVDLPKVSPTTRVIAQISRSKVALALGSLDTAAEALRRAKRTLEETDEFRVKHLLPDLLILRAQIEIQQRNFVAAAASLTEGMTVMGPERAAHRATALLARASIFAKGAEARVDSERDVSAAVALLRTRAVTTGAEPLRLDDASAAFESTGSLISSQRDLQGPRGLHLLEQLREMLDGAPTADGLSARADFDRAIGRLGTNEAAVVFLFADQSLLAWAITDRGVEFVRHPVDSIEVGRIADALAMQVNRTPNREDRWRPTLSRLYDLLLRDLPEGIHSAAELTIVPDGPLNRVPFGALFDSDSDQFMFERTQVRVSPNLAFALPNHRQPERESSPLTAMAVGEPMLSGPWARQFQRLPRAKSEAVSVAGLYRQATTLVGANATKAHVLEAVGGADVLHFAGHAVAANGINQPRLLLAGDIQNSDSTLSGADLRGRFTRPVRVVLAACRTGTTSVERAAGMAGLSAGFLRVGAASVVATLWDVDDSAGEQFFLAVHRGLAAGQTTPMAVALAQRDCRADPHCRSAAPTWIGTTVYGSH